MYRSCSHLSRTLTQQSERWWCIAVVPNCHTPLPDTCHTALPNKVSGGDVPKLYPLVTHPNLTKWEVVMYRSCSHLSRTLTWQSERWWFIAVVPTCHTSYLAKWAVVMYRSCSHLINTLTWWSEQWRCIEAVPTCQTTLPNKVSGADVSQFFKPVTYSYLTKWAVVMYHSCSHFSDTFT